MKAPKCRLCQKEHWPREGCSFAKPQEPEVITLPPASSVPVGTEIIVRAAEVGVVVQASASDKMKFDRTAYQREYMRDKRLADGLGLTVKQYRTLHRKG